jgi:steroid delta-isomerase-like uncharacterized protein
MGETMYRETNKATCRRFIQEIFNEGNLSSIRDFVSPDSVHHELGGIPAPAGRNPEWFADSIDFYRVAFPDLRVEIQDQVAESDRVVTRMRMRGTQKGRLVGIGASGKAVDIMGIRIDRLNEGKIAESWFHWDSLGMLQQIGALPDLARKPQTANTTPVPTPKILPLGPKTARKHPSANRLRPAA